MGQQGFELRLKRTTETKFAEKSNFIAGWTNNKTSLERKNHQKVENVRKESVLGPEPKKRAVEFI